jgi:hypothetical protein
MYRPSFLENKPKTIFFYYCSDNERFGLAFAKTGSINSVTASILLIEYTQHFVASRIRELNARDSDKLRSTKIPSLILIVIKFTVHNMLFKIGRGTVMHVDPTLPIRVNFPKY